MTLPTETIREDVKKALEKHLSQYQPRFDEIDEDIIKQIVLESVDYVISELSLSQNRILEEVEKLRYKVYEHTDSMFINGHTQALEDIIKLISKKDN